MPRLKKLPRRGTWEVGLVHMPQVQIDNVKLEGMLLVVETRNGLARAASPVAVGDDIAALLLDTTHAMHSIPAGRPKTIRCDPAIIERLREPSLR